MALETTQTRECLPVSRGVFNRSAIRALSRGPRLRAHLDADSVLLGSPREPIDERPVIRKRNRLSTSFVPLAYRSDLAVKDEASARFPSRSEA